MKLLRSFLPSELLDCILSLPFSILSLDIGMYKYISASLLVPDSDCHSSNLKSKLPFSLVTFCLKKEMKRFHK